MGRPAVFLDRDGTLTEEVGYVNHPLRLRLIPVTAEAMKLLNEADVLAILATNQAGVARGYFEEEMILKVHDRLEKLLAEGGARLDAIYYCPHHPSEGPPGYRVKCDCRKPGTGMIEAAAARFGLDPAECYVVGDKNSDVEFGRKIGARTVLVLTGYGLGEYEFGRHKWKAEPDCIAHDLLDAVKWILADLGISSERSLSQKGIGSVSYASVDK